MTMNLSVPVVTGIRVSVERTPALHHLLGMGSPDYGPGAFCPDCPFAGPSVEPYDQIWNDVTEAHYPCRLLGKTVWGEYSPCTNEDWQLEARREIGVDS